MLSADGSVHCALQVVDELHLLCGYNLWQHPPVSQLLVLFFKARWQSFVLLVLQNSAKYSQILVPPHQFPCWHQARILLRFLVWSPALGGCHMLPPVFNPSCVLALTSMPWGSQELSKGWRSPWQCRGSFGGLRSAFGVAGLWRNQGPSFGGQVCWQQESAVGWHLTGTGSIQGKGRV